MQCNILIYFKSFYEHDDKRRNAERRKQLLTLIAEAVPVTSQVV